MKKASPTKSKKLSVKKAQVKDLNVRSGQGIKGGNVATAVVAGKNCTCVNQGSI